MQRYLFIAAAVVVAALLIWHPVPQPSGLTTVGGAAAASKNSDSERIDGDSTREGGGGTRSSDDYAQSGDAYTPWEDNDADVRTARVDVRRRRGARGAPAGRAGGFREGQRLYGDARVDNGTRVDDGTRIVVYVAGAVRHPGLYALAPAARAADAIRAAGGALPDADPLAVNLAEHLDDGDEVAVLRVGEARPGTRARTPYSTRSRRTRSHRTRSRRASDPPPSPIDPNVADADTLAQVPGIGPAIAQRIVQVREIDGAFASLDELLDVAGMTPARLDRASPYLVLAPR